MFSTSRRSSIRNFFINWKVLVALGSLLSVVLIGAFIASHFLSVTHTTFTVNKMERVQDANGSKYLIYTKEGEVFENTDNLLFGKFNSSDLYNKLNEGQTYTCKVNGFRIPLMSSYRNILSCE